MRAGPIAVVFYGASAAVAVLVGWLRGAPDLLHHPWPWLALSEPHASLLSIAGGLGAASVLIVATRLAVRRLRTATALADELATSLGPSSAARSAALALGSALGEELLFRGALQPLLGLHVSALLFALLHLGPPRTRLFWTSLALLAGLLFGLVFEATGSLLGPIVAHALVNHVNLRLLAERAETVLVAPVDPAIVPARSRRARPS
ncbi:MAG: type II CAAX endopeptidase family protein [Myxococcales bacterium]|nr:type II CAAX endopeptidase family protein [Myxococcales bacterium]